MTTKTKDWKKKWIGDVIKSDLPDKHPVYLYDNIKSLHLNYDYHLNKLSKITIRQLLDDPKFVYLMLPFIQKVPYFHWTRAELEARKDEIFECLGTQIIDNSSFQVMDYSPVISGETVMSLNGTKFTLVNPSGPKKMRIYWYFDDLYIEDWRDTEFVNLLEDREESDEIITTDFTLPKNHIDYLLLTPESEEPELVREIGRLRDKDYSYRRIKGEISDLMGIQVSHTKIKRIIQKSTSYSCWGFAFIPSSLH